ncbi:Pimeloyl-ACP methyl ester carboxylesterase [Desulfotomaculum arcticum]|uniref:Pimeloyl-ACP methyl ester carboxylesterase n=1 Tax=Desulfotruncus arcticus DSM 17038 TaxID=1121424 RepID=A0A1I2V4B8_9FIRM|nr:alpha/beta hydrolase [Desulfotruncus arcticus]SFG84062.1 Pimeloyl-ACP methyl ester carboxylesterase [Desulfotomaculum arcticum] [Desulfotruncus arcticus DSM 17038]
MDGTIVMIHGMMGGSWCWDNYRGYFEGLGYKCTTPVLRFHHHGPGEKPDPRLATTGLLEYASDLEMEIRKLNSPPIIMGHSMGGLLAQILGSRIQAKALVLLTPAAPSGIIGINYSVLKSFSGLISSFKFWKKTFRISYQGALYAMLHLTPGEDSKKIYERLVYESGLVAYQIGFWFLDSARASAVDHTKVHCPVLVIAGQEDRITPASIVNKIACKYAPNSTYKVFENHAHWVLGEPGWQEIAGYIDAWLKSALFNGNHFASGNS